MADLTSCYFCGTVEGVEEGPAVPPAFDPPATAQQSVVLCHACREKLTAVLGPVFESERIQRGSPDGSGRPEDKPEAPELTSEEPIPADDDPATRETEGGESVDPGVESDRSETPARGSKAGDVAGGLPDQYHTVVRFLENREFPVAREEIEGVVAGAYDLSEREVGEILDAAVDREVLLEESGRLARSPDQL